MTLRTRIVLLVALCGLIVVVGSVVTVYAVFVERFERLVADREQAQINQLASELSQSIQQRLILLESFAPRLQENGALLPEGELSTLLGRSSVTLNSFSAGLLVLDTDATAIAESDFVEGRIGTNYSDRPHFKRLLESQAPVVSEPILGRTTGLPLLSFLVPIFSESDRFLGILGGVVDLSSTSLMPEKPAVVAEDNAVSMVIDPVNRLYVDIWNPISEPMSLPAPGENSLVDAAVAVAPSGALVAWRGTRYLITTRELQGLGWIMLSALPYDEAVAGARRALIQFVLIVIAILILAIILGWLTARRLTQSLTEMAKYLRGMARGEGEPGCLSARGGAEVAAVVDAMNEFTEERRRVDALKDDFVSNVSHELRTPLTSIHGGLRLLESGAVGDLSKEASALASLSYRNSERLLALIQDLLDFNKLTTGQLRLASDVCDLLPIVRESITAIEPSSSVKSLKFVVSVPDQALAIGDQSRVRQILDNLLSNAVKHSPDGGQISVEIAAADSEMWRVTVSDQGHGVPDAFSQQIFQRFAQADHGADRVNTGTGLGLAISRELVHRMGGMIGYYNRGGAHFWFDIPRHDD